jgi:hypothetical protein
VSKGHTVIMDWDGTAVANAWPGMGDWMPGTRTAWRQLLDAGANLTVASARISPYDPFTAQERPAEYVEAEIEAIRTMLDVAGLQEVRIWTLPGKPGGDVYVDDKGLWYPGRPGSWRRLVPRILQRLELADNPFPVFEHEEMR